MASYPPRPWQSGGKILRAEKKRKKLNARSLSPVEVDFNTKKADKEGSWSFLFLLLVEELCEVMGGDGGVSDFRWGLVIEGCLKKKAQKIGGRG